MLRRRGKAACALTAIALSFLAATGCGSEPSPVVQGAPPTADRNVKLPPELRALERQASQLLDGGKDAFEARVAELRGHPVVVNQWASWCGPCRFEFPFFQAQADERGDEVAFLGVDSNDSEEAAATFLRELPLPYPSYLDPDSEISEEYLDHPVALPATGFYGADGKLAFVHQGPYDSADQLAADIDRYAQ